MDRLRRYILSYTAYGKEPLHLLISSALSRGLCATEREMVPPLVALAQDGLLEADSHTGRSGDPYQPETQVTEGDLLSYIERNRKAGFASYPEEGGEYFFRASRSGRKWLKNNPD